MKDAVTTVNPVTGSESRSRLVRLATGPLRERLAEAMGLKAALDDTEVEQLYWLLDLGGADDTGSVAEIRARLGSELTGKHLKSDQNALVNDKALTDKVKSLLKDTDALDTGLRGRAANWKAAFLAKLATDTKPSQKPTTDTPSPKPQAALKAPVAPPSGQAQQPQSVPLRSIVPRIPRVER